MRAQLALFTGLATLLGSLAIIGCNGSVQEPNGEGGAGGEGGAPACGEAPPDAGPFAVGTGEDCFSALAANQEVPLMSGPQGGYHVWLAIGCKDCGDTVTVYYGARDAVTHMTLANTYDSQAVVTLSGDDWPQAAGMTVIMPGFSWDPESQPPLEKGTHVIIWAQAYDGETLLHEAEAEVTIGDIEEWNPCAEDPNAPICQTG
jgi:hypothetical protein